MVLYLGDGANSGCKDELDVVFGKLVSFRKKHKIPVYYLIGNHDYLGAGNQSITSIRENLCDNGFQNNPPETKIQVLQRIRKFNLENSAFNRKFLYQEVFSLHKSDNDKLKDISHFYSYYGSILKYINGKKTIEFFLMDSSDYANTIIKPYELWGIKGGISYQEHKYGHNSQLNDFVILSQNTRPDYRFIASHYQPEKSMTPSLIQDDIIKLLAGKNNYWLSGHTHTTKPKRHSYKVGKFFRKKTKFLGLNVGSTTDYFPHIAILEARSSFNNKIDNNLGYRVVKYKDDESFCSTVFTYVENNIDKFQMVSGSSKTETILGVDKAYRNWNWSSVDVKRVRDNINVLIQHKSSIQKKASKDDIVACVAMKGVKAERSFWDKLKN